MGMGLKHPIGETVKWFGRPFTVVGVIKDMIVESPYTPIRPFFFIWPPYSRNCVIIKINPTVSTSEAAEQDRGPYLQNTILPCALLTTSLPIPTMPKNSATRKGSGGWPGFFTMLAIFISCMGLFGMASFVAEQRIKEIGVRKVLRGLGIQPVAPAVQGIRAADRPVPAHRYAGRILFDAQLAPALRVPSGTFLVDLRRIRSGSARGITILTVSYQSIRAAR